MEGIQIALAELTRTSGEVRRHNTELEQELLEMKRIMVELGATWQSPASDTIRARFLDMVPIFENYREIIESYAKFLDYTVTSYETTEQSINQSAASF